MSWACPVSAAAGVLAGFIFGVWRTRRTVMAILRDPDDYPPP